MKGPLSFARSLRFGSSGQFWERRYAAGGTSGAGSYGLVAGFKAEALNDLVERLGLRSVIELGCGDGHQLSLARYPSYLGLDVSRTAVRGCIERFAHDRTKSFLWFDPDAFANHGAVTADLALSLDVLLHLVEDDVYDQHLRLLFASAARYVAIFSPDEDRDLPAAHVRYRAFRPWIEAHAPDWTLLERIDNPHKGQDSVADLWVFARRLGPGT